MKKNRKNGLVVAIVMLLLVGISVGYAAISTTLNINGTSSIGGTTWDVHFENVKVSSGSVTATTAAKVETDTTKVTYAVTLSQPGDYYEFTVDVKNAGTLAAKLSAVPTLSGVSTAQDVYTNYTVTYSDGTTIKAGDTLAAGATKTLKVRVEFDSNITSSQLPTTAQSLTLACSMNYVQA